MTAPKTDKPSLRRRPDPVQSPWREPELAFYTVTNSRHFVGVVGLINSLRLTGHYEPIVVTDTGLTDAQRSVLASVAEVVGAESDLRGELAKPVGPLRRSAETMVVLDADVLVVKHLGPLIEEARKGKLVFFENDDPTRFFEEWSSLGRGQPRRAPYVIAGHYLGPRSLMCDMLEDVAELQSRIDVRTTYFGGGDPSSPYFFADQDIMNALLMTSIPSNKQLRVSNTLSPLTPFAGVTRVDGIRCRNADGTEPYLLHHVLRKPWLHATKPNVYVDVLRAVLWAQGAQIRIDTAWVPLRLRPTPLHRIDQFRAAAQSTIAHMMRGRLGVRRRLARHRLRRDETPSDMTLGT